MRRPLLSLFVALAAHLACSLAAFAQEGGAHLPAVKPEPTMGDVLRSYDKSDWERVIDDSRRALTLPEYWFPEDRADLLCMQADALLNLGRNEAAIQAAVECRGLFEKSWGSPPERWSVQTIRFLTKARMRLGRFAEAAQALDEIEKQSPKSARQDEFLDFRAILDASSGFEVRVDYAGKFAGRPEIAEEYERLRAALPQAMDLVERRLGVSRSRLPPGRVILRDPKGDKDEFEMRALHRWRGKDTVALVLVNPQHSIFGQSGEAASLAHELTHVLRYQADGEDLPFWMSEGIAHWVEDETEDFLWGKVIDYCWRSGRGIDPGPIRRALRDPGSWEKLPKDLQRILGLLLFRHVERTRGTETARRLVQYLVECRAFPAGCFWSVVLQGPEELAREAADSFTAWCSRALKGFEEIPEYYAVLGRAKPTELSNWAEEFAVRHPGSPLCAPVVCDALLRMTREKRIDLAETLLGVLRRVVAGDTSWTFSLVHEEFRIALLKQNLPTARRLRMELDAASERLTESSQEEFRKEFDEELAACEKDVAAADDGEKAPVPAAPLSKEAPPREGEAPSTVESVQKAQADGDYQGALDGARRLLTGEPAPPRNDLLKLTLAETESCFQLGRYDEALLAADRGLRIVKPGSTHAEAWTLRFARTRALALVGSWRFTEGERALDELVRGDPASDLDTLVHSTRAVLKASHGHYVDPQYRGTLAADPRIPAALKRLEAALPPALEAVRRRMGDPTLAIPPVLVVLTDNVGPGVVMATNVAELGSRRVGVIRVCARCAAADMGLETSLLTHELTHVLRLVGSGTSPLEGWEEEGLAHWMQQDQERGMWEWVFSTSQGKSRLDAILDLPGISDPARPWSERTENEKRILGELLFRHLERTRGRESVQGYARALFRSTGDPREDFRAAFGADRKEVQIEVHQGLPRWMRSDLDGFDALANLRAVDAGGDLKAMVQARKEFLSGHPESILGPFVRRGLFQVYEDNGRWEEAAGLLGEIRKDQASGRLPVLMCEFKLARARSDLRDVVDLGTELLRFFHVLPVIQGAEVQAAVDDAKKRLAAVPAPPVPEPAPR